MGNERFPKGSVELTLHASWFKLGILKGVEDGPIFRAHIKRDEVSSPVVPWATANGDGGVCGVPGWGEVVRAGPPCGGFSKTEHLV